MEKLEEEKAYYKKHQGQDMDDPMIAKSLHKLQLAEVKDEEVVLYYTQLNHLELRVKNVAISKMLKQLVVKDTSKALTHLIESYLKGRQAIKKSMTKSTKDDKLIERLRESMYEVRDRINKQRQSLMNI